MMPLRRSVVRRGSRMTPLLLAQALALLLSLSAAAACQAAERSAPDFVPGFPDVPLMQGLAVEEDDTVVFDKPSGRIAEASAVGHVAESDLVSYYTAALPALGWRAGAEKVQKGAGRLQFVREGEVLQIEFASRGRVLDVRFFLSPS